MLSGDGLLGKLGILMVKIPGHMQGTDVSEDASKQAAMHLECEA